MVLPFTPEEIIEPTITLFGIIWLYSIPCIASLASLFARNAQFLPFMIWAASIYNVWQYDVPLFFVLVPAAFAIVHGVMWFYEDYYIPITRVNSLVGLDNSNYKNILS